MFDYSGLKNAADRLLERFGTVITVKNADNSVNFTTFAVKKKYLKGALPDTLVDTTNEDAYIVKNNGNTIENTYYVDFGNDVVRTINTVDRIQPGDTLIAYDLQVAL